MAPVLTGTDLHNKLIYSLTCFIDAAINSIQLYNIDAINYIQFYNIDASNIQHVCSSFE